MAKTTKTLILVDGALTGDSFLHTQLGLDSIFDFRVGAKLYREVLHEKLLDGLSEHRVLLVNDGCSDLSVAALRERLEVLAPDFRQFDSIFIYPSRVYFEDFNELVHIIKRSVGSPEVIRLGVDPDLYSVPLATLDELSLQQRKISSLEPSFRWSLKSKTFNLEVAADVFEVWRLSTQGRYFNSFVVEGPFLKKTSEIPDKARREHFFLSHVPACVRPFFPQVGEFFKNTYELEYIPIFDLSRHLVHGNLNPRFLKRLFTSLDSYYSACPTKAVDKGLALAKHRSLFIEKVDKRVEELTSDPGYTQLKMFFDRLWPQGLVDFHAGLKKAIEGKIETWSQADLIFSHGDLCMSNILFDGANGMVKLIDPRGAEDIEEFWFPRIYDLAKLSHSFVGYYELVKNDIFDLVLDPSLKPEMRFKLDSGQLQTISEAFCNWLSHHRITLKDVRLAEASLFLSMLPLHKDDPRHQVVMFHQAVEAFKAATKG